MEKLIVRIGKITDKSSHSNLFNREPDIDTDWLMVTLEISYKRAVSLRRAIEAKDSASNTKCVVVSLTYRQLARYVAKRQVEGLNKYWKWPMVLEHTEDKKPSQDYEKPIELRLGARR